MAITGRTRAACLLVGAGGAASAIAFALAKHGCASLTIRNRTTDKAEDHAARLSKAFPQVRVGCHIDSGAHFDIAVNGTSVGMKPTDELSIPESIIVRTSLVADCILAPEVTRLLETAKAQGRQTQTGVPMLAAQMSMMLEFMGVE